MIKVISLLHRIQFVPYSKSNFLYQIISLIFTTWPFTMIEIEKKCHSLFRSGRLLSWRKQLILESPSSKLSTMTRGMSSTWRCIDIPHICHKYHKWDMWRKICHVENFFIYMHDRCREIWNFSTCWVISNFSTLQMWRNLKFLHIWHVYDVENVLTYVHVTLFCLKIGFVVIYAVLSQNLFCRDLRTFVWRKIEPKITYVEKKWQISGMDSTSTYPSQWASESVSHWPVCHSFRFRR